MRTNVFFSRNCAFCKNWYDPTNSAIKPIAPQQGIWEYEDRIKCKCLIINLDKPAFASCDKFQSKI